MDIKENTLEPEDQGNITPEDPDSFTIKRSNKAHLFLQVPRQDLWRSHK